LLKLERSFFADTCVCSKWQQAKGQGKHVLQPKLSCRRKSHQNALPVIANRSVSISGSGNCIDRDASLDYIAEIMGLTKRSVYRALKQEAAPPMLRRARSSTFMRRFRQIITERDETALHPWAHEAAASRIPKLVRFAQRLHADWEAAENALLFASSQGQTEGPVNRLKSFKRQGYGRAGPVLLQARLVGARDLYLN
jgi:Transposase